MLSTKLSYLDLKFLYFSARHPTHNTIFYSSSPLSPHTYSSFLRIVRRREEIPLVFSFSIDCLSSRRAESSSSPLLSLTHTHTHHNPFPTPFYVYNPLISPASHNHHRFHSNPGPSRSLRLQQVKSAHKLQNNQSKMSSRSQSLVVHVVVFCSPVVSSTLRSVQTVSVSTTPTLSKIVWLFWSREGLLLLLLCEV